MIPQRLVQRLGVTAWRSAFSRHSRNALTAAVAGGALAVTFGGQTVFADEMDDLFSDDNLQPPAPAFDEVTNQAKGHFQLNISPGVMIGYQYQGEFESKGPSTFGQLGVTTMIGVPNDTGHATEWSAMVVDEQELLKMLRCSLSGSCELSGTAVVGLRPKTDLKFNFVLPGLPTGQPPRKILSTSLSNKGSGYSFGAQLKNLDAMSWSFTKTTSPATLAGIQMVVNFDEGTNLTGVFRYKDQAPWATGGSFVAMLSSDYMLNLVYVHETRSAVKGVHFELYGQKRESVVTLLHKFGGQNALYEYTLDTTGVLGATFTYNTPFAAYSASYYHPLGTPQHAYGVGVTFNH